MLQQLKHCSSPFSSNGSSSSSSCRRCSSSAAAASKRECIVIGGGIGGLVTAGKLARDGNCNVTVLEQNAEVGGRCQSVVTPGGFRFDAGPSLLLFPDVYKQTFEELGARLEDHVQLARVEPAAYRVFFAQNQLQAGQQDSSSSSSLDLLYDVQAMVQQLERVEQGAGTAYVSWLSEARRALVMGMDNFIARDFDGLADFLDPGRLLPLLGQVSLPELLGNHHQRLRRRFKDPRIPAMLSFQDLYVGLSPYTAPGVFSLLAATEITDGVFYPVGGFGRIVSALAAVVQQAGVVVRTSTRVEEILTRDGAVTGVRLSGGKVLPADLVVSNRDVSMTFGICDAASGLRHKQKRLAAKEYSAGIIAYYWSISKRLPRLTHHNVFLSDDYQKSWQRARTPQEFRQSPNFYLHAPCRTDASAAPPGCDSIMVLLPVANMQERAGDSDHTALVDAGRRLVLRSLAAAGVDLAGSIVEESVRQPADWREMYALEHGAAFGLSHGLGQLALLRPGPCEAGVNGLFLVGASSRPGNGVPLVMLGGRLAAERIMKAFGR